MAFLLAIWLLGCDTDADCAALHGPESILVGFTVDHPDAVYDWTLTGDAGSLACRLTLASGDGVVACDGAADVRGPEPADGGGVRFGAMLATEGDDPTAHVTLDQNGVRVLDDTFAPTWDPVASDGACADVVQAAREYDLR